MNECLFELWFDCEKAIALAISGKDLAHIIAIFQFSVWQIWVWSQGMDLQVDSCYMYGD